MTLKIEIGNWKFGLHAFVLLINAFNFVYSFISPKFLLSNFKFQAVNDYKISPFGRNDKKRGFRSDTIYAYAYISRMDEHGYAGADAFFCLKQSFCFPLYILNRLFQKENRFHVKLL